MTDVETLKHIVKNTVRRAELRHLPASESAQSQGPMVIGGVSDAVTGLFTPASMWGIDPFPFTFTREGIE